MKKLLSAFFLFLGVVFFLILVALGYIYTTNTFGIKSLVSKGVGVSSQTTSNMSDVVDKNPLLSPAQENALEKIGVDPAKLPSKITPEMIACFTIKLGNERTLQIKNGDSPTAVDYIKAQSCFR